MLVAVLYWDPNTGRPTKAQWLTVVSKSLIRIWNLLRLNLKTGLSSPDTR